MATKRLAVYGAMILCLAAIPARADDNPAQTLTAGLKHWLEHFKSEKSPRTRDLNSGALLAIRIEDDVPLAEKFLTLSYNSQEMDSSKPTFGQLRWLIADENVTDMNAIEFGSLPTSILLLNYKDRLSPQFMASIKPHLDAALFALNHHHVKVSYTNIWLMNSVNLMLLGQAMNDPKAIAEGQSRLNQWIAFTSNNGIGEFDSPNYYGVDVNELSEGYRYCADEAYRKKCATILDYFWTDIAANFFAPAQRLAIPYSRDYDFLTGHGDLDAWLTAIGWAQSDALTRPAADNVFLLENLQPGGYVIPKSIVDLAHSGPRMVQSAWGAGLVNNRFSWQGESVQLGCASGYYEPQDKLAGAMFAGPRTMTQIVLDLDDHDAPYGLYRQKDRTGHPKPWHLMENLASVQSQGTALITLDIDPSKTPADASELSTNWVLPSDATIAVDGAAVDLSTPTQIPVKPDSVVTITVSGATVGIRLLKCESLDGKSPTYLLASDADGLKSHAVRLKLGHTDALPKTSTQHLRVAFIFAAADTDKTDVLVNSLRNVKFHEELSDDAWDVGAALPDVSLEVERSTAERNKITSQKVNGKDVERELLSVDGKDLAAPVWAEQPER